MCWKIQTHKKSHNLIKESLMSLFLCLAKLPHNYLCVLEGNKWNARWPPLHKYINAQDFRNTFTEHVFPAQKKSASDNSDVKRRVRAHNFTIISHPLSHEWNHRGAECQDSCVLLFVFSLNCCMPLCNFGDNQGNPHWARLCKCNRNSALVGSSCTGMLWC